MPTIPYYNAAGVRVPGTTTVIGQNLGWSKDGLMYYAWEKGKSGKDFRDYTKDAADIGTMTHAMVEEFIHGREWKRPEGVTDAQVASADIGFRGYKAWARNSKLEIVETEVHGVSEKWQFGGCIDAIILADDEEGNREPAIGDWKTSNGTYADHLIQLRAYRELYEEVRGIKLTGGYHLFRFGKTSGNFVHHWWPYDALEPAWKVFTHLRNIHEQKQLLERLAK